MREQARQAVTVAALCVLSVAGYQVVTGGDGGDRRWRGRQGPPPATACT